MVLTFITVDLKSCYLFLKIDIKAKALRNRKMDSIDIKELNEAKEDVLKSINEQYHNVKVSQLPELTSLPSDNVIRRYSADCVIAYPSLTGMISSKQFVDEFCIPESSHLDTVYDKFVAIKYFNKLISDMEIDIPQNKVVTYNSLLNSLMKIIGHYELSCHRNELTAISIFMNRLIILLNTFEERGLWLSNDKICTTDRSVKSIIDMFEDDMKSFLIDGRRVTALRHSFDELMLMLKDDKVMSYGINIMNNVVDKSSITQLNESIMGGIDYITRGFNSPYEMMVGGMLKRLSPSIMINYMRAIISVYIGIRLCGLYENGSICNESKYSRDEVYRIIYNISMLLYDLHCESIASTLRSLPSTILDKGGDQTSVSSGEHLYINHARLHLRDVLKSFLISLSYIF